MASSFKKTITLKTSDNVLLVIDELVARESRTIHHMIEVHHLVEDDDDVDGEILLPDLDSAILSKVLEYCEKHLQPLTEEELKSWDAEFVKVDQDFLFELILAADYLDVEELTHLCCETIADMIKNLTPQQIRVFFGMDYDLKLEEEALDGKEIEYD